MLKMKLSLNGFKTILDLVTRSSLTLTDALLKLQLSVKLSSLLFVTQQSLKELKSCGN